MLLENYKPTISQDGKEMEFKCPNGNFILTITGEAGTLTIYRSDAMKRGEVKFNKTYEFEGGTVNYDMSMFPFGCYVRIETTGTFSDAHVNCGRN